MHQFFQKAYENLPRSQLQLLRDNENLKFYLSEIERADLSNHLICVGDRYYVYDLNSLWVCSDR